jgi:guanyl-specific ribonuclease Sa
VAELARADAVRLENDHIGLVTETRRLTRTNPRVDPSRNERRVLATIVHWVEELVTIHTAQGEVVTTPDHPFMKAGSGWTPADRLVAGDEIVTAVNDSLSRIELVERFQVPPTPVYNMTVEGTHTYYVGIESLLVHNVTGCGAGPSTSGSSGYSGMSDSQVSAAYDKAEAKAASADQRLKTAEAKKARNAGFIADILARNHPETDETKFSKQDQAALAKARNIVSASDKVINDVTTARPGAEADKAALKAELEKRKAQNKQAVENALKARTFDSSNSTVTGTKDGVPYAVDLSEDLNKIKNGDGGIGRSNDGVEFGDKGNGLKNMGAKGPFVEYTVKDLQGNYTEKGDPNAKVSKGRIVVDTSTGKTYYSSDHYNTFVEIP